MHSYTLNSVISENPEKVIPALFEEFANLSDVKIAKLCDSGVLTSNYENPIERARVFYQLIDDFYIEQLRCVTGLISNEFEKSGIAFRLSDIHEILHGYRRMALCWTSTTHEYYFDVMWEVAHDEHANPKEWNTFYRIWITDGCGDLSAGDILEGTEFVREFSDESIMPRWFTDPLKAAS